MKGWQFEETHKPLKLVEKADPTPKPDYVIINVKAGGLCHTDVGILEDEGWMGMMKPPVIIGHELAGVITAVGDGVTKWKAGDKVGLCPMPDVNGNGCGFWRDGGYGTLAMAHQDMLVRIPDGVSFIQAAAMTDAGMTSYHAVAVNGGAKPGVKMGLIGIGGLGQVGCRIAVLCGADVYVSSRKESARQEALDLGAKAAVATAQELAQFGCNVIVDFAGSDVSTPQAIDAVAFGGKIVRVGMASLETTINIMTLITHELTIIGSQGGTPSDIEALYSFVASGKLEPVITEIGFNDIPDGLEQLKAGKVKGRMVANMETV
jgi:propanol-preferring alcohol dehydrogenase